MYKKLGIADRGSIFMRRFGRRNLLRMAWFLYMSLMLMLVFTGAQQIYTFFLTGVTMMTIILNPRRNLRFKLSDYSGTIWYALFAVYVNVSLLWSRYGYNATGITGWVIYIVVMLFCADFYFSKRNAMEYFHLFSNAGVVFCITLLLTSPVSTYSTDRFSGITGQYRTWIGEMATMLFTIDLCLYRYDGRKKQNIYKMALAVLIVLLSGARGALLHLLCAGFAFIIFERSFNRKIKWILLAGIAMIMIGAIIFMNTTLYNAFIIRMLGAIRQDGSTQSLSERFYFMSEAWELFLEKPILGNGVDAMRGYLDHIGYWHVTYSHCEYTEILSSYGIIGAVIFFYPAFRRLTNRKVSAFTRTIVLTLLLGFIWSTNYYSFLFILLMSRLQFGKVEFENES